MNDSRKLNLTQKLIQSHLVSGAMIAGEEIGLTIDQTLCQDATGTLVMLELEAMELDRARTDVSVQYVDHNLIQNDFKNADDHLFLESAARRFGLWFSRPGNGISHPLHTSCFGVPGKTLLGSDSHTPSAGCLGMYSMGAGGLDVAFAIAGEPIFIKMPKVLGVEVTGKLPDWVSAKDVVLEMLRRYDVKGCRGMVIEYYGPGIDTLSVMDRHVIANMGTEMGATTTVFPSDSETRRYLESQGRGEDWTKMLPDANCDYDLTDELDLSGVIPLVALPSSPGNVVPVRDVEGKLVHQVLIGSSANPGLRDFWIVSEILKGRAVHPQVSLDINPSSRQVTESLATSDAMKNLIHAGARFHQSGCMGCIGMGQAPATGTISLRTVPRNFPGRSGTLNDQVHLVSPETGAASALTGVITDPRDLEKGFGMIWPAYAPPKEQSINMDLLVAPIDDNEHVDLRKGPNIKSIPDLGGLEDEYKIPALLKMEDNISTDEILRGGTEVLALRSNIPEISKWAYYAVDPGFFDRAMESKEQFGGHIVVAGSNYAQGSSREHAALAPRYLGQVAVIAKTYARIGWQNLVNFGILPLEFVDPEDYAKIDQGDMLRFSGLLQQIQSGGKMTVTLHNDTKATEIPLKHSLSDRQVDILTVGGVINYFKSQQ